MKWCGLTLKMLLGGPALFFPLTSEPRRTQTGEPAHSVHTGGSVPAGLRNALIHINLTVSALEPRHTEARVSVPADSAYRTVLARVWRAQVRCWRQPVRRRTYEQIIFQNINTTEYHCSWYVGCTVFSTKLKVHLWLMIKCTLLYNIWLCPHYCKK